MAPQSGPSLPPVVAVAPQQRVVELECCGDTGVQAAQEGAPPQAAHGVAGCTPSDAPLQTGPRGGLGSEGLHSCGGEESLGTPEGGNRIHEECSCFSPNSWHSILEVVNFLIR